MQKITKNNFYQIYAKAHNNAVSLLLDAEILYQHKSYPRAYFLAFTGLEELSKSQLAADVYTGFIKEEEFWKKYSSHKEKISRIGWASIDAREYIDERTEEYLQINIPRLKNRMDALYVGVNSGRVNSPKDLITPEDSWSLIHTLRVGIDRVIEITEYWGHQIGTKGFMK